MENAGSFPIVEKESMAEDIYEISMLLDFYGQLLTDSQYKCMDMHYNQDLSLSEIAEELGISRLTAACPYLLKGGSFRG